MVFDMHRIGQTIARLRRERNMTQMQLADEMGVSFQAVSNWERGQSMPDISKLPELAELFSTTIDDLLGHHAPLILHAMEGKLDTWRFTLPEVEEAAPLLPPKQLEDLADKLLDMPNLPDMGQLLPFLPTEKVDALLRQRLEKGQSLQEYAVFASTDAVDNAARTLEQQLQPLADILPFMSEDLREQIARDRCAAGQDINDLLPFLYEDTVDELARQADSQGRSVAHFLPFMTEDALDALALTRLQQGRSITELLPFEGERLLTRLAEAASTKD